MRIRALVRADLAATPIWLRERSMLPDRWRDEQTRTLIAEDGAGEAIGAGAMWTSRVHPDRYSVDLIVAPAHRRAGIATALLAALADLQPVPKPLIWEAAETDPAHGFAATVGARTIQRAPLDTFQTSRAARLSQDDRVTSAGAIPPAVVGRAWADMYGWTHADWHPVGPDARGTLVEDLCDEIDPHLSSIAVSATGAIDAVLLVFTDSEVPVIAGETVARDTAAGATLLAGCVRRTFDQLAGAGVAETLLDAHEADAHEADPHFAPLFDVLGPVTRWHRIVQFRPRRPA